MIDPDSQGDIGLLLLNGGKEKVCPEYRRSLKDPVVHPFVLPCHVINVHGKLQQTNANSTLWVHTLKEQRIGLDCVL